MTPAAIDPVHDIDGLVDTEHAKPAARSFDRQWETDIAEADDTQSRLACGHPRLKFFNHRSSSHRVA